MQRGREKCGMHRTPACVGVGSGAAARPWRVGSVATAIALIACQSLTTSDPILRGCIEESAWPAAREVMRERDEACGHATQHARCDREAYLETVCDEINAYRGSSGLDPELANVDVRFPWPAFQWLNAKLELNPGHAGSESWADHLGLAGFHDNSIKRRRRAVMNVLTFGLAQHWYDARGLGSPPD